MASRAERKQVLDKMDVESLEQFIVKLRGRCLRNSNWTEEQWKEENIEEVLKGADYGLDPSCAIRLDRALRLSTDAEIERENTERALWHNRVTAWAAIALSAISLVVSALSFVLHFWK